MKARTRKTVSFYNHRYHMRHREERLEKLRQRDPEKRRRQNREYYYRHRAERLAYQHEYRMANHEALALAEKKRKLGKVLKKAGLR